MPYISAIPPQNTTLTQAGTIAVEYDSDDLDTGVTCDAVTSITLNGDSITADGSGATVNGSTLTITSAGTYSIGGTLNDGQIRVDTKDEKTVRLVLNGAKISCSTSAPIYVVNAEKTVITLADGTENAVSDGDTYVFEDVESDEPNAAIFSKDDLKITGGTVTVNAGTDGIQAETSAVTISGGTITIDSSDDAVHSNGGMTMTGGNITLASGDDGMHADSTLEVEGGEITMTKCYEGLESAVITINDGTSTSSHATTG